MACDSCLLSKVSAPILSMNTFSSYGAVITSCTHVHIIHGSGSMLLIAVELTEEILKRRVYWVDHLKTSSSSTRALLTLTTSHVRRDLVGFDSQLSAPSLPFLSTSRAEAVIPSCLVSFCRQHLWWRFIIFPTYNRDPGVLFKWFNSYEG